MRLNENLFRDMNAKGLSRKELAEVFGVSIWTVGAWRKRLGLKQVHTPKTCEYCKGEFVASRNLYSRYCSETCRNKAFHINTERHTLKCKNCGVEFTSARNKKLHCSDYCATEYRKNTLTNWVEKEKELNRRQHKAITSLRNALQNTVSRMKVCDMCQKEFIMNHDGNKVKYCKVCINDAYKLRRRSYNRIDKDRRLRLNGKPDYSITLEKLHKKDNGVCYLCNKQTDYEDFKITEEGYFIAGENYPSIDHVMPIAKGGEHQWDNVRLAHRHCNAIKNDKLYDFI